MQNTHCAFKMSNSTTLPSKVVLYELFILNLPFDYRRGPVDANGLVSFAKQKYSEHEHFQVNLVSSFVQMRNRCSNSTAPHQNNWNSKHFVWRFHLVTSCVAFQKKLKSFDILSGYSLEIWVSRYQT